MQTARDQHILSWILPPSTDSTRSTRQLLAKEWTLNIVKLLPGAGLAKEQCGKATGRLDITSLLSGIALSNFILNAA